MEIYAALLLLPLAWWFASERGGLASRATPVAIFVFLALAIGLRFQVGGDWDSYLMLYSQGSTYPLDVAVAISDPAYQLTGRLLARLGLGVWAINLVCATIFSAGLVLFCHAQPRPGLALLIAVPVLIVIVGMGFTRQSAALGLLLIGLAVWRKQPAIAVMLILFAPAWHWSAILFIPLIPLLLLRGALPLWTAFAFAGLLFAAIMLLTTRVPGIAAYVGNSGVSRGALMRLSPNALAGLLLLFAWSRLTLSVPLRNGLWYWLAISVMLVPVAFLMPTVADRIGSYAIVGQMALLARLPDAPPFARMPRLSAMVLAAPSLVLFVGWLTLSPYRVCWAPYRNYLAEPELILLNKLDQQIRTESACAILQRGA